MLNEMSSLSQQAWLANAVAQMHPNDQMHLPKPQAMLSAWTQAACIQPTVPAEHIRNLARYWSHGLRFPAHAHEACIQIRTMLGAAHLREDCLAAIRSMLEGELQPLRMMRLWALLSPLLAPEFFLPHFERLLAEPLPVGKKLKITQVDLACWRQWLPLSRQLTPTVFERGMVLHVRAQLTSRESVDPSHRAPKAWEMLNACQEFLPEVPTTQEWLEKPLPLVLSVLLHYADSQTLRHLPWPAVQEQFAGNPDALMQVFCFLFEHHKTLLLHILPQVQPQYHADIRQWFEASPEFMLEEDRCAPMLALVRHAPQWGNVLHSMLAKKNGYTKLGNYLLGTGSSVPDPSAQPGAFLATLNAHQWERMFASHTRVSTEKSLTSIWQLARIHGLRVLASCAFLQNATLLALQGPQVQLRKVAAWDVTLGLPEFYASLLDMHVPRDKCDAWFNDWLLDPSQDKMVAQAFQWFNPSIAVPALKDLHLLRQALATTNIMDVLSHLGGKTESFELPDVVN